jgi:hypothetical protein
MKLAFINKDGKAYKTAQIHIFNLHTTGRLKIEPLGAIPGEEKVIWKSLAVFKGPLDLKGLGQLTIRHYDEVEHEDTGFTYLPAFKRIVRVSATTYQDNVGGSDMTWGDPEGLREPFVNWEFKHLGAKPMFCSALEQSAPFLDSKCMPLPHAEFTEGVRFPVAEWAVTPMHIIEAVPKIPHIYSKKVLHILAAPYWSMGGQACVNDIYDRQGKLWKHTNNIFATYTVDGDRYPAATIAPTYDLQSDHSTAQWFEFIIQSGIMPVDCTLKKMIELGR